MTEASAVVKFDFEDELKVHGINAKGYGILPKFVMLDKNLTIEAKAIYAYFCSYSGSGNTLFPCRDKIVFDLNVSKDTYYKHFNALISAGYVQVEQSNSVLNSKGFKKNIYHIATNPNNLADYVPEDNAGHIMLSDIYSYGFGTISKLAMQDPRLDIKAKGIYAYYCSFAGSNGNCFPKRSTTLDYLQISTGTYSNNYNKLVELGYITVVQRKNDGKFSINDYYINLNPSIEPPCIKFSDTKNCDKTTKIQDNSTLPCINSSDTKKSYTKISDTRSNNIRNNSIGNNNTSSSSEYVDKIVGCLQSLKEDSLYNFTLTCFKKIVTNTAGSGPKARENTAVLQQSIRLFEKGTDTFKNEFSKLVDQFRTAINNNSVLVPDKYCRTLIQNYFQKVELNGYEPMNVKKQVSFTAEEMKTEEQDIEELRRKLFEGM